MNKIRKLIPVIVTVLIIGLIYSFFHISGFEIKNKDYVVVHSHVVSSYTYRPHALLKLSVTFLTIAVVIAVLIVYCR